MNKVESKDYMMMLGTNMKTASVLASDQSASPEMPLLYESKYR